MSNRRFEEWTLCVRGGPHDGAVVKSVRGRIPEVVFLQSLVGPKHPSWTRKWTGRCPHRYCVMSFNDWKGPEQRYLSYWPSVEAEKVL